MVSKPTLLFTVSIVLSLGILLCLILHQSTPTVNEKTSDKALDDPTATIDPSDEIDLTSFFGTDTLTVGDITRIPETVVTRTIRRTTTTTTTTTTRAKTKTAPTTTSIRFVRVTETPAPVGKGERLELPLSFTMAIVLAFL